MNRWLRRALLLTFVLVWLLVMLTPTFAVILTSRGQIQLGGDGSHLRVFLLQGADAEGLGFERVRQVKPPPGAPAAARCTQTKVNYLLWAGEGEGAVFCQCLDAATGAALPDLPPACLTP